MNLAPDSYRYLGMGAGQKAYPPFNRRVLFPLILRDNVTAWKYLTRSALVALPLLVGVYTLLHTHSWPGPLFAAFLMASMPSVKFWIETPVLVDAPALCLAVLAAILPWPYNLAVAAIGGLGRETVPLFAALYAWNPLLLIGLVPVGIWTLVAPKGSDQVGRESWLDHPFKTAQEFKAGTWRSADAMLWPWGAGLAGLLFPTPQLMVTLVVAYAQLIVATDWARLYVWAAPVLLLQAAQVDPSWMVLLAALHWCNPKRGEGF